MRILLVIKEAGDAGISKYASAKQAKTAAGNVQTWRTVYQKEGISPFLEDARKGFKPSTITAEEHVAIEEKLNDPRNGLRGYKELKDWYETTYGKEILCNTLLKYCVRHFKSSCKVARQFIDNQTKLLSDSIIKSTCFRKWFFLCNYRTDL